MENTIENAAKPPAGNAASAEFAAKQLAYRTVVPQNPDTLIALQMAQCHIAIGECFECSNNVDISVDTQLECLNVAERLMRVSLALAAGLDHSHREFVHRIIVERPPPADVAPTHDVAPKRPVPLSPPPPSKSKTIPGAAKPRVRDIG